jgi:hypothetical protein
MTEVPPQIPAFSPEDLVQAILLIDEGVNQGAYRGWETIQKAIAVRARLLLFAQHWQGTLEAQQKAAEGEGEATTETEATKAPAPKRRSKKASA